MITFYWGGVFMKRIISIICCVGFILSSVMLAVPASGIIDSSVDNTSIEEFAEDMLELYSEEVAEGKELEDSVACRVMVKATVQPDTYKNAECVVGNNNLYIYQYSDAETAQKAVEYYSELPYVKWAELDGIVESQALSYGNYMMQGDEAKEFVENSNLSAEEIKVAVLDTGAFFEDPQYEGRAFDSGYNLTDTGFENSAESDHPHGDYVTSVIINNSSENVKVYAYKVLNEFGYGTNSSVSLGIDAAVADGADVINMSLSAYEFSHAVYDSIKTAYSKGVIIVCAAGNDGDDVSKYYPATFDEVFTVGSIDRKGNYSFFSNHGEEVDFVAPGHNIEVLSTEKVYGTSFSAPFVTAAAAMVLSINPDLSIEETKSILIDSSVPYEKLSYYDGFHVVEDYENNTNYDFQNYYIASFNDDESLYYGYGMPQIQNAIGIALDYEKTVKPEFSVDSGTYHEAFEVTISAPEGYEIYYTTDETYPSKNSATLYTSPIKITGSQSIRAVAYSSDGMRSLHNTAEYRVLFYADENDFTIDSDGYLLSYNGNLKELIVPETINGITIRGIRKQAFYYEDFISIVLPETLTHIEQRGLRSNNAIYISAKGLISVENSGILCRKVVEFDAPNLEHAEAMALGVRDIYFPKLSKIGGRAFSGCSFLKSADLPLITEIPYFAFSGCNVLREINCPLVTTVDSGAFENCSFLKKINIPNLEKFISTYPQTDSGTFQKCINLKEIDFPNLVTTEECKLFYECYNLRKVRLRNIENICAEAFSYCTSLSDAYIPKAQVIGDYAFSETSSLTKIRLPSVKELGNYAFKNSSIEILLAPKLETIGQYCFTFYNNMHDTHNPNTKFSSLYAPKLKAASDYAFAYTGALTKLELPSLTELGENAFLESAVSYLDAPMLKNASSLLNAENSVAILSSEFSDCSLDATGYDLTIYGTPETYAQTYAEQYGLTFIPAPAIINDLPAEYFEGVVTFDVAGFGKKYQWHGTNNINSAGTPISGAKSSKFVPSGHNYKYFYCVVTSNDNGYTETVKTSLCQNMLYSATAVSANARIIISTPSNRYLKYGESVNLYANATGLPEGAKIKWRIVEGSGVTLDPSVSGKICTVTSKSNGNVTIEAYAVDKNGNSIVNKKGNRVYDREGITSEVSLWWIILYYIKKMFSISNAAINSLFINNP